MIVVKTLEEAKQATAGFTTTYFTFQKKKVLSDESYQGHVGLIDSGRKFGNQVMVGFWYLDPWYFDVNTDKSSITWDRSYCLSWADQQKVDIVWAPEFEDEEVIIDIPISKYYEKKIDKIWADEHYDNFFINIINKKRVQKLKHICLNIMICDANWKYMISDEDGISGIIQAHFINNYTNSRAGFLTLDKSPYGLNYSSSYFKYTDKEKAYLASIKPTIERFDLSGDIGVLKDRMDDFGKEIDLKINRLEKFSNDKILGPGKKLVEVGFSVGKDFATKYDNLSVLIN